MGQAKVHFEQSCAKGRRRKDNKGRKISAEPKNRMHGTGCDMGCDESCPRFKITNPKN